MATRELLLPRAGMSLAGISQMSGPPGRQILAAARSYSSLHRHVSDKRQRQPLKQHAQVPYPSVTIAGPRRAWVRAGRLSKEAVVKATSSSSLLSRLADAQASLRSQGISLSKIGQQCLLASATFGFAFQVTHNQGKLPVYDVWPFNVGPFLESGLIPFLLAPIWLLYGFAYPVLDEFFDDPQVAVARRRSTELPFQASTWTQLAATFVLSDWLYVKEFPSWQISGILALTAIFNWWTLDRTKTGLLLGALLFVGAPTAESLVTNLLGFWHYERPDTFGVPWGPSFGVPHWAGWCYAAYAYGVGNFARFLQQKQLRA